MTGPTETLEHLDVDPALRPLARAMAVRGPGWWSVLRMELRKTVDTRAGRWVLAAVLLLAVAASVRELSGVGSAGTSGLVGVSFPRFLGEVVDAVVLLLPVVGVLATTREWTRHTALSTFTLVPRRGRVVAAEVAAALVVVVATALACSLVALAASALAAQQAGVPLVLDGATAAVGSAVATTALATLAAAGLGALAGSTPAGVVTVYALPLAFAAAVPRSLGDASAWLDGYGAIGRVAQASVTSWPQTGTALALWVVLPLVAGTVRSLRREVS